MLEGYHCLGDSAAVGQEVAAAFIAAAAASSFKVTLLPPLSHSFTGGKQHSAAVTDGHLVSSGSCFILKTNHQPQGNCTCIKTQEAVS